MGFDPNFEVLIHSSEESLNNALYDIEPIRISKDYVETAMFTKTNLNSISTQADPCADKETLTGADLAIKKVIY